MSGAIHSALAASAAAAGGLLSSVHPSTVSLGPPLPPPPHLLPYLYPGAGLYPGGPSLYQLSQLLHHHHPPGMMNSAAAHMGHMGHNLLLNAQLAFGCPASTLPSLSELIGRYTCGCCGCFFSFSKTEGQNKKRLPPSPLLSRSPLSPATVQRTTLLSLIPIFPPSRGYL